MYVCMYVCMDGCIYIYIYIYKKKKAEEQKQKTLYFDLDFRTAFDSIHREKQLQTMQKEGVKGKCFASINSMYGSLLSCVNVNSEYSNVFALPCSGAPRVCTRPYFSLCSLISLRGTWWLNW